MKALFTFTLLATLLFTAACSKDPAQPQKPADPKAAAGDPHAGGNIDLGTVKIGEFQVLARRGKELKPGAEAHVELDFLAGKLPPGTVRGWIGVQDATGSVKEAFTKEGDHGMHGHAEVPKPVPAGSKLWIELESGGTKTTGSFDLKQ